ncbi:hypothetical protein [Ideonella sp.]|uniref:hypothetical protein n=1 Tax=Ideonella sp. TaxID=1929293 RepID=UPI0035B28CF8
MKFRPLLGLLLAFTLAGCVTRPVHDLPDMTTVAADKTDYPGLATVYVLRAKTQATSMFPVNVLIDGQEMASLRRKDYARIPVKPGSHEVKAHWNPMVQAPDVAVRGDFVAGKTYWLMFDTAQGMSGMQMTIGSRFRLLNEQQAREEMKDYDDRTRADLMPKSTTPAVAPPAAASAASATP